MSTRNVVGIVERFFEGKRGQPGVRIAGRQFIIDQDPELTLPIFTPEIEGKNVKLTTRWDSERKRTYAVKCEVIGEGSLAVAQAEFIKASTPTLVLIFGTDRLTIPILTKSDWKRATNFINICKQGWEARPKVK